MAKMVTVSLAEACAAIEKEAEAQELADKAANTFYNSIVVGNFDEIHNALEEAVEEFDATDNESDAPECFVKEINGNHISILEINNSFEVGFNGDYAIVEDLSGKSLMQLARYFNHR